jgi:hypothetical protein
MRQWSKSLWIFPFGLALIAWGIWADHFEAAVTGVITQAIGIVWDLAHARQASGADVVKRLRLSRGKIRVLGWLLAVFAALTALGVVLGVIPFELVLVMLAFAAAAPILAFPYLFFYRRALARTKAAESWPTTRGKVGNSFMEQTASAWPAPIVIYNYEVDGRTHHSSRVRFGGTSLMNPVAAEELLARYPSGAEIDVYYDPKRPGQSVLDPKQDAPPRNLLWGAGLTAAAPLLGAVVMALFVILGLIDAVLTAAFGHRVLP